MQVYKNRFFMGFFKLKTLKVLVAIIFSLQSYCAYAEMTLSPKLWFSTGDSGLTDANKIKATWQYLQEKGYGTEKFSQTGKPLSVASEKFSILYNFGGKVHLENTGGGARYLVPCKVDGKEYFLYTSNGDIVEIKEFIDEGLAIQSVREKISLLQQDGTLRHRSELKDVVEEVLIAEGFIKSDRDIRLEKYLLLAEEGTIDLRLLWMFKDAFSHDDEGIFFEVSRLTQGYIWSRLRSIVFENNEKEFYSFLGNITSLISDNNSDKRNVSAIFKFIEKSLRLALHKADDGYYWSRFEIEKFLNLCPAGNVKKFMEMFLDYVDANNIFYDDYPGFLKKDKEKKVLDGLKERRRVTIMKGSGLIPGQKDFILAIDSYTRQKKRRKEQFTGFSESARREITELFKFLDIPFAEDITVWGEIYALISKQFVLRSDLELADAGHLFKLLKEIENDLPLEIMFFLYYRLADKIYSEKNEGMLISLSRRKQSPAAQAALIFLFKLVGYGGDYLTRLKGPEFSLRENLENGIMLFKNVHKGSLWGEGLARVADEVLANFEDLADHEKLPWWLNCPMDSPHLTGELEETRELAVVDSDGDIEILNELLEEFSFSEDDVFPEGDPKGEIGIMIGLARKIPGEVFLDRGQYIFFIPNQFCAGEELTADQDEYQKIFDLRNFNGTLSNLQEKLKTVQEKEKVMVLLPDTVSDEELEQYLKETSLNDKIRFLRVDIQSLYSDNISEEDIASYRLNIYSMMLLARQIDKEDRGAIYLVLKFMLGTHFQNKDELFAEDFIEALCENNLLKHLKILITTLSASPIDLYNIKEYHEIAGQIVLSA